MIQETSVESYKTIYPKIGERQKEVLNIIKNSINSLTDMEITKKLGKNDPNYVRPRRNELVNMGIVIMNGKRKCRITGKIALTWEYYKKNEHNTTNVIETFDPLYSNYLDEHKSHEVYYFEN